MWEGFVERRGEGVGVGKEFCFGFVYLQSRIGGKSLEGLGNVSKGFWVCQENCKIVGVVVY